MKLIFIGSGAFAVPSLEALGRSSHELLGLFAQPDKPAGRGHGLSMPKTKAAALELGIPVHQPAKIRAPEAVELVRDLAPELIVVVAYGQIIPRAVLEIPPKGIINVHASLLPAYRGAAPIQWAIASGEKVTGVTTMLMDEGLDTGPVLLSREHPIAADETTASLEPALARLGAELLLETVEAWGNDAITPKPQDDAAATLAPRIKKEDGRIDWSSTALVIDRRIRAFQPWPVAYAESSDATLQVKLFQATPLPRASAKDSSSHSGVASAAPGTLLAIEGDGVSIACGEGTRLRVLEVQAPGRARMSAAAFARGRRLELGAPFP